MTDLNQVAARLEAIARKHVPGCNVEITHFDARKVRREIGPNYGFAWGKVEYSDYEDAPTITLDWNLFANVPGIPAPGKVFFHELGHVKRGHVQPASTRTVATTKAPITRDTPRMKAEADGWAAGQLAWWDGYARARGYRNFTDYITRD